METGCTDILQLSSKSFFVQIWLNPSILPLLFPYNLTLGHRILFEHSSAMISAVYKDIITEQTLSVCSSPLCVGWLALAPFPLRRHIQLWKQSARWLQERWTLNPWERSCHQRSDLSDPWAATIFELCQEWYSRFHILLLRSVSGLLVLSLCLLHL